jgi:hypothetical protein
MVPPAGSFEFARAFGTMRLAPPDAVLLEHDIDLAFMA